MCIITIIIIIMEWNAIVQTHTSRAILGSCVEATHVGVRKKDISATLNTQHSTRTWGVGAEFPHPENPVFAPSGQQHNASFVVPVVAAATGFALYKCHGVNAAFLLREVGLSSRVESSRVSSFSIGRVQQQQHAAMERPFVRLRCCGCCCCPVAATVDDRHHFSSMVCIRVGTNVGLPSLQTMRNNTTASHRMQSYSSTTVLGGGMVVSLLVQPSVSVFE